MSRTPLSPAITAPIADNVLMDINSNSEAEKVEVKGGGGGSATDSGNGSGHKRGRGEFGEGMAGPTPGKYQRYFWN